MTVADEFEESLERLGLMYGMLNHVDVGIRTQFHRQA